MQDYVYPSIFFSYFLFFLFLAGALFFFVRSLGDGYWGKDSENAKFRMLADDDNVQTPNPNLGGDGCRS
ncbi:MAG: hypothetical protein ACE14L_07055 [Terriglobales bacterium]